jgi:hypothetical protein
MAELVWGALEDKTFERGVDHGVLYVPTAGIYAAGYAWNGLTTVTESPAGAESNKQYADNGVYVNLLSAEEFNATIECFAFPNEFLVHDGVKKTTNGMQIGMQSRPVFGFSWRSLKGDGTDEDLGYVLNLAYGLQASPSEKTNATVNDSPELKAFSFAITSTPVPVTGYKPTAIIKIDSTDPDVTPEGLAALESALYGQAATPARLPLPDEVDTLLATAA